MRQAGDEPSAGAPEGATPEPDPLIGRTIAGKFVVEHLVGVGSMGAVYRAQQVALDRAVAIKVMRREVAADATYAARFHLEAKAASRLDHPNVIQVLDYGQEPDGLLYIAMEFLDCRPLSLILSEDWPLSQERIVDILSQALSALAEAHELGVLHRDLKPENMMVLRRRGEDGTPIELVKVCDFGIAKLTRDALAPAPGLAAGGANETSEAIGRRLTTGGLVVGTPEYMAPEQARGEALDARSDVYAIGVVLYQLLSRRLPFEAKTPVEVIFKAMYEEPRPLGALGPTSAPGLDPICVKAICRLPEDRFQSAREMRAALRAAKVADELVLRDAHEPAIRSEASGTVIGAENRETVIRDEGIGRAPARPRRLPVRGAILLAVGAALVLALRAPPSMPPVRSPASPVSASAPGLVPLQPRAAPGEPSPQVAPARSEPVAPPPRPAPEPQGPREARRGAAVAPSPPQDISVTRTPSLAAVASLAPAPAPAPAPADASVLAPSAAPSPSPPATSDPPRRPAASSPFNRATARVELGFMKSNSASATSGNVSRAMRPLLGRFTACYQGALAEGDFAGGDAIATLHLESDEAGYVTVARLGGEVPPRVAPCIEAISRSARIEVDTGTADADVTLTFKPR